MVAATLKQLSLDEVADVAVKIVTPLFDHEDDEYVLARLEEIVEPDAWFIMQGNQYTGAAGLMLYRAVIRSRFNNIEVNVTSVVNHTVDHTVKHTSTPQEAHVSYDMSAVHVHTGMPMQLHGLGVAVLSSNTGKITKGVNSFNFGEVVEKAQDSHTQLSDFYGLQQMQFNRALKHIEVAPLLLSLSSVHSCLHTHSYSHYQFALYLLR